jgi:YD repeat-containing protein
MLTKTVFVFLTLNLLLTGCADKKTVKQELPEQEQRLVREIVFRADNSQESMREFFYSDDGRQIIQEKLFDPANTLRETVEYIYGENKLPAERHTYSQAGKLTGKKTYTYTPAGQLQTESFYNEKGESGMVHNFVYDNEGRRTEWKTTDAKGGVMAISRYVYENGQLTGIFLAGANGIATMKIDAVYDRQGKKIFETYTNIAGGLEKETVFTYDSKNRLASQETFSGSRIFLGKTTYEYPGDWDKPEKISYFSDDGKSVGSIIQEFAYTW